MMSDLYSAVRRSRGLRKPGRLLGIVRPPERTTASLALESTGYAAGGFLAGLALGAAAWSWLLATNRSGLFSKHPMRRFAAVGYLRARPSVDTARLLRDYIRWEPQPFLRRRAREVLRLVEASLDR
jgi:hypothetical protein